MKKKSSYISYKILNGYSQQNSNRIYDYRPNTSFPYKKSNQKRFSLKDNKELNNSVLFTKRKFKLPLVSNSNLNNSTEMNSSNNLFLIPNTKKSQYNIEKEQLLEETMRYKIKLNKLKKELSQIKNDNLQKQYEVNIQDNKIEEIIKQNEDDITINPDNILQEDLNKLAKLKLRKKIKEQIKEVNTQLNNEKLKKKDYAKEKKTTKKKEILITNKIIEKEIEKIYSLVKNSIEYQELQKKKIQDFEVLQINLNNQNKIMNNLEENYTESFKIESELQNKIEELKFKLLNQNTCLKKFKSQEENLKNQNHILQKEKFELSENSKEDKRNAFSLITYERKILNLKSECSYFKSLTKRNEKEIVEAKKILDTKINIISSKEKEEREKLFHFKPIKNDSKSKEDEKNILEKIKNLKEIYELNKNKENELEQKVLIYQETLKRINTNYEEFSNSIINENLISNDDLNLNPDNPYYTSSTTNQPLNTKLFTNEQFNQFTYVLFKNFEAKKINIEKAKSDIIDKVFDDKNIINSDEIVHKFGEIVSNILMCENKDDIIRMQIFFGAICFSKGGDTKKTCDYFINLFSFIQNYSEEDEEKLTNKIRKKYKEKFIILYQSIVDFVNKRNDNENKDYISLIEIKIILDNLSNLCIKDKYIEFIFYKMKQFKDPQKSLFDLKISNLQNILGQEIIDTNSNLNKNDISEKKINNVKDNNNISLIQSEKNFPKTEDDKNKVEEDDSFEEISREEYEKAINETLLLIKLIMEKENKTCFKVFEDSIVKISHPESDIITIESFNDELVKRGINLTELQLSCICNKYCINEDLKALNIHQINSDIKSIIELENSIKEEDNKEDLNGARIYDNEEDESNNSFDAIQSKRKYTG